MFGEEYELWSLLSMNYYSLPLLSASYIHIFYHHCSETPSIFIFVLLLSIWWDCVWTVATSGSFVRPQMIYGCGEPQFRRNMLSRHQYTKLLGARTRKTSTSYRLENLKSYKMEITGQFSAGSLCSLLNLIEIGPVYWELLLADGQTVRRHLLLSAFWSF
jgi:hypothetical protein